MRKLLFSVIGLFTFVNLFSQNVGIGTTTPAVKLDVKSTTNTPAQFNGIAPMFIGLYEADVYKGYLGSYSGAADDIDIGTGGGNALGKLHLTIQASPRMTIDNVGNVGIGLTNPAHRLHVTGGDIFLQSSSGSLRIGYEGSNQWRFASTGGGAHLLMVSSPDGTVSNYRHYFEQNGDVGIGTGASAPAARLHIQTTASEVIRMDGANPYMSFYDDTDGYQGYLWYNGGDIVLGSSTAAVRFASSGYRMTINTDGRVSIGTLNTLATGYLLNVDGKIISEELKVQLSGSWPDYVFNDNYKLMSIDDLEKNVRQNKHLPNIPSAAEITAEKGFEVGEMNRKLLEKVEELTLYIFELNRKNKLLEEKMKKIEQAIVNQ